MRAFAVATAVALLAGFCVFCIDPPAATALPGLKTLCGAAGEVSGVVGKLCNVAQNGGRLVNGGKKLLSGHPGAALKELAGGGAASTASTALALTALVTWATGGAKFALRETAKVLSDTTDPQLRSTWFSGVYWRMATIATLLTLPFLFAAAVQALLHSDLAMLLRAAFGYLPLAMLAVSIAAPLTMLLLSASDQMSAVVSSAGSNAGGRFLGSTGAYAGIAGWVTSSPFVVFLLALFVAAGAIVLWLELAIREAAVYVVVLMLPLAFAALVWPARRIWAIRAVELLVALILSKFAIVAVLTLGGAALDQSGHSITGVMAGAALVTLGAFAPWALLRLLPLAEIASSAAASLRPAASGAARQVWNAADSTATASGAQLETIIAAMRNQAGEAPVGQDGAESADSAAPNRFDSSGAARNGGAGVGAPEAEEVVEERVPVPGATGPVATEPTAPGSAATQPTAPGSAATQADPSEPDDELAHGPTPPRDEPFYDKPNASGPPFPLGPEGVRAPQRNETGVPAPGGGDAGEVSDPLPPEQPAEDGQL